MSEAIRFYCGVNEKNWNQHPTAPGPYACIAPVYGQSTRTKETNDVEVPGDCFVIQDSGAFSDSVGQRLTLGQALERQYKHSQRYHYDSQVTHRASYDLLVDERWSDERTRSKERWSELDAEDAVSETIEAARFLSQQLYRSREYCVLSAQGVTPQQYLRCAQSIAPLLQPGDIFGLGGWCITGKYPAEILPIFIETMKIVIPFLGREGIKRVHVWGVCFAKALGTLLTLCDQWGISVSVDSANPQMRPLFGRWGYAEWSDYSYTRPPIEIRGLERARHVRAVREWLANFRETPHYQGGLA